MDNIGQGRPLSWDLCWKPSRGDPSGTNRIGRWSGFTANAAVASARFRWWASFGWWWHRPVRRPGYKLDLAAGGRNARDAVGFAGQVQAAGQIGPVPGAPAAGGAGDAALVQADGDDGGQNRRPTLAAVVARGLSEVGGAFYRGMRVLGMDGQKLTMPDTPANAKAFGRCYTREAQRKWRRDIRNCC